MTWKILRQLEEPKFLADNKRLGKFSGDMYQTCDTVGHQLGNWKHKDKLPGQNNIMKIVAVLYAQFP